MSSVLSFLSDLLRKEERVFSESEASRGRPFPRLAALSPGAACRLLLIQTLLTTCFQLSKISSVSWRVEVYYNLFILVTSKPHADIHRDSNPRWSPGEQLKMSRAGFVKEEGANFRAQVG